MAEAIHAIFFDDFRTPGRFCPFGYDDNLIPCPFSMAFHEQFVHPVHIEIVFRDEDDIGAARLSSFQRQPASVPSHRLHYEDPPVRTGCCSKAVDLLGDAIESGLKSQCIIGS